jgi:CRP/FNR family transcriptional regulator, cyclic AMP receptor protein
MVSLDLLRRFPFFSFMDDPELRAVSQIAQELHLQAGEVLAESNKPADALYFLVKGHMPYYIVVTTEHIPDYRQEYFVGYLNPEEIIGISALIEPYQYTATLRADEPVHVIKINASALRALCEVDSHLSVGLMKAVAKAAMERLQMTRIQLVAQMPGKLNEPAV